MFVTLSKVDVDICLVKRWLLDFQRDPIRTIRLRFHHPPRTIYSPALSTSGRLLSLKAKRSAECLDTTNTPVGFYILLSLELVRAHFAYDPWIRIILLCVVSNFVFSQETAAIDRIAVLCSVNSFAPDVR